MQIEVETKVQIQNPTEIRKKIKTFAKFKKKIQKQDTYYTFKTTKNYPDERFRIRRSDGNYIINFKHRESPLKKIQIKEEFEFQIKDINAFKRFLKEFNFKPFIHKIKNSEVYKYKNTNIELNYVKHLGYFIEIENITKNGRITKAKQEINEILKKLKIKPQQINNKGYTRMLYEKGIKT